eukprot:jgi/Mesvir1/10690/Mv13781-RA.1
MASRFWSTQNESDSGSGSDTESDASDMSQEEIQEQAKTSKYLAGAGGSDSSDADDGDARRVVKSHKDKRFEEMNQTIEQMKNHMKINDWIAIQLGFEKLNKQLEKVSRVAEAPVVPRVYVKAMVMLEDFLTLAFANKEAKKKMSSTNAKALNYMKQKLKKNNAEYKDAIDKFRANPESSPEASDEDESDASQSESDSESGSESGSESSGSGSDSEADEDEEDDDWERKKSRKEKARERLLLGDPAQITYEMVDKKLREIIANRGRKGTDRAEQVRHLTYLANVAKTPVQRLEVMVHVVSAQFDVSPGLNTHMPIPVWKSCMANLFVILDILNQYPNIAMNDAVEPDAAGDDEDPGQVAANQMKSLEAGETVHVWGNLVAYLERLDDELFKSLQCIDPHSKEYVERLRDEPLFLMLSQEVQEYMARMGDHKSGMRVALRRVEHVYYKHESVYQATKDLAGEQARKEAARIEAAKNSAAVAAAAAANGGAAPAEASAADAEGDEDGDGDKKMASGDKEKDDKEDGEIVLAYAPRTPNFPVTGREMMRALVMTIYEHGDERAKARAVLCDIYHRALHDRYHEARDALLMSHLQDNISFMDVSTQILFNRAMSQLGLCAFRAGLLTEAHACLSELYAGGRIKELLAQGVAQSRYHEKSPEQEKIERRRQMPFHTHINLELLEAVHLICAMLLEVPNMAANAHDVKRRVVSKVFRRLLDNYDRQTFTGPPENLRDNIMCASKALGKGDWRKAAQILTELPVWGLLQMERKDALLAMLRRKLQEEGLRTYLFAYSSFYDSLSLDQLAQIFELTDANVHSIVSKMIIAEELRASWDQPTRSLVMHNVEPSRLQHLAAQYSDKCAALVEANERVFELQNGMGSLAAIQDGGDMAGMFGEGRGGYGGGREGRGRRKGTGTGWGGAGAPAGGYGDRSGPMGGRGGGMGGRGGFGGGAGGGGGGGGRREWAAAAPPPRFGGAVSHHRYQDAYGSFARTAFKAPTAAQRAAMAEPRMVNLQYGGSHGY